MDKHALHEGHGRFEFRSGNGGVWGGMVTNGDPARNSAWNPRMLVNADIVDGEIRERPGLVKRFASVLHTNASIRNIVHANMPTPFRLYIVAAGCPGLSPSVGFSLNALDTEQDPEFQRMTYYSGTASQVVVGKYNRALYVGTDSDLRRWQAIRVPWGKENLSVSGSTQDTPLKTFSGFTIKCLREFDGMLFIGLDGGAGASKVVTYDGISFRDDVTGIDPPTCFADYRVQNGGDAIVMGTSTGNNIYIRPAGDSPGTWTSIGTAASVDMISYKDVLYIATGGANVSSWNGTTLTAAARSPAGATAVLSVEVFNGLLYFSYETASAAIIGKYDGSSWTDAEKNITTQFSGTTSVRTIASYCGFLVGGGTRSSSGRLWVSPGTTTSGTWVEVVPNVIQAGNVVRLLAA